MQLASESLAHLGKPSVHMTWRRLLFAHWRVDASALRQLVPAPLEVDTFDGSAWVGLVPFEMVDTRFRGWPRLPGLGRFFECNVRTYVRCGGHTGVWFLSLDAARRLPVIGGRLLWGLNYRLARFQVREVCDHTEYALKRNRGDGSTSLEWHARGEGRSARPGSLEEFLVERYSLFASRRGKTSRGQIWHKPWPLRDASIVRLDDSLLAAEGLPGVATRAPDHVMASDGVEVIGWNLARVQPIVTQS